MLIRILLVLGWQAMCYGLYAQNYPIGSTLVTFVDTSRGNRAIETEIYYPAETAGLNTPLAPGAFPVVVFGHGFTMPASAYGNIAQALVPYGFIVGLPRTESGFAPSHLEFALDLAYVVTAMQQANTAPASAFFQHVEPRHAIGGHSMGGGAALLAAASASPTAIFALAPAETNPGAIAASAGVTAPALLLAGSYDCITPVATNAGAMYTTLGSDCRIFVVVDGGSHCQFADENFNCTLGETLSGCSSPPITREQQHERVMSVLRPWLSYLLRDACADWDTLQQVLATGAGMVAQQACADAPPCGPLNAPTAVATDPGVGLYPVPVRDELTLQFNLAPATEGEPLLVRVFDARGRGWLDLELGGADRSALLRIPMATWPAGCYHLVVMQAMGRRWQGSFVKL
jgi:pimeloyl-ACP methyl ester carboxylesterase